jgi:hypothetical protein
MQTNSPRSLISSAETLAAAVGGSLHAANASARRGAGRLRLSDDRLSRPRTKGRGLRDVVAVYFSGGATRYEFHYDHINESIAQEMFQSPTGVKIERKRCELEEGYDYFHWRVCDGSDGEMHAGYGQTGRKGGNGDGM